MSKPKNRHKLRYPACPHCGYNLQGTPTNNNLYTCSECGNLAPTLDAHYAPTIAGHIARPLIIATLPPVYFTMLGTTLTLLLAQHTQIPKHTLEFWFPLSCIINLWTLAVTIYYTRNAAKWKGPNDWNGPKTTFLLLAIGAGSITFTIWMSCMITLFINIR